MQRRLKISRLLLAAVFIAGPVFEAGNKSVDAAAAQILQQPTNTNTRSPLTPPVSSNGVTTISPDAESSAHLRRQQEKSAMTDRHQRMVADADKLLQMATELKAEVDKSAKDETSITAYNKADAIEKLAHDVKQRLKN